MADEEAGTMVADEQVQTTESVPAESNANSAPVDNDREVFDRLTRNAEASEERVQPDSEPDESVAAGEANTETSEADEAQPDVSEIVADPQVAKQVEALGIKPDEALDRALAAFKRVGVLDEDEIVAKYQSDPKAFVTKGLKLAKSQRDQDQYGAEYRSWKAKGGEASQEAKPTDTGKDAQPAPAATGDIDQLISEAMAPIGEDPILSDSAEPLKQGLRKLFAGMEQRFQSVLSEKDKAIQQTREMSETLRAQLVDAQIGQARAQLAEKYPDLADESAFQRVLERYDIVAGSGKFKTVAEVFTEAARWELGEVSMDKLKQKLLTSSAKRKAGQPRAASAAETSTRAMTPEDKERLEFHKLHRKHFGPNAE